MEYEVEGEVWGNQNPVKMTFCLQENSNGGNARYAGYL